MSYFTLRSLRLRGENDLFFLFCALVTLAYAGVHSCLAVNMDFRIRENDGKGFPPLFRVIPCSSVANASDRSLFTPPRALVTLAYAGVHSLLAVSMDFRIRENDGKVFFFFFFRVIPWQMLLLCKPSLTLVLEPSV